MEDMSLSALFEYARKIHATTTESDAYQEVVKMGCEDMVNNLDPKQLQKENVPHLVSHKIFFGIGFFSAFCFHH